MPTIPTGKMERELRRLYFRWLHGLGEHTDMNKAVDLFERQSIDLIERMGGRTAALGALADFPVPKRLDLSPHIGTIYSDMKQAAIQAGIQAGLQATDVARAMMRAGMDTGFHRVNRLARTETVSAYWKNAWDSIEGLDLVMIWGSEDGPRTCEWCRERDGMVMTSPDLRDHPNGRCTPLPTLRSRVDYKGSVGPNGVIYQDPEWTNNALVDLGDQKSAVTAALTPEPLADHVDDFGSWEDLSEAQRESFAEYQRDGYTQINAILRGDPSVANFLPDEMAKSLRHIAGMRSAMKTPSTDLLAYRGTGSKSLSRALGMDLDPNNPTAWDINSLKGKVIPQKSFTSFSGSANIAAEFAESADRKEGTAGVIYNIRISKDVPSFYMRTGSHLDREEELLSIPGTVLVITGGRVGVDASGKTRLILEAVMKMRG